MVLQSLDPSDLHWYSTPRISTHPQPSRDGPCEIPHTANSPRETRFPLACLGQRLGWVWGSSAVAWPGHPDKAFTHPARGAIPPPPLSLTNTLASPPKQHRSSRGASGREFYGASPQTGLTPKEIFNIESQVGEQGRAVIWYQVSPIPAKLQKAGSLQWGMIILCFLIARDATGQTISHSKWLFKLFPKAQGNNIKIRWKGWVLFN